MRVESVLIVRNALGLHSRPAAKIVEISGRYSANICLHRKDNGASADCRSILEVLMLSAGCGTELVLEVEGDDAEAAVAELSSCFINNFGE